jgi:hypothetical protein
MELEEAKKLLEEQKKKDLVACGEELKAVLEKYKVKIDANIFIKSIEE